jgi:hypothetical protein
MRLVIVVAAIFALAGCRGEPVPRDYQNHPPEASHPPQSATAVPAQHGGGDAPPQPSTGVEGTVMPYEPVTPPTPAGGTTTLPDTPPATGT